MSDVTKILNWGNFTCQGQSFRSAVECLKNFLLHILHCCVASCIAQGEFNNRPIFIPNTHTSIYLSISIYKQYGKLCSFDVYMSVCEYVGIMYLLIRIRIRLSCCSNFIALPVLFSFYKRFEDKIYILLRSLSEVVWLIESIHL